MHLRCYSLSRKKQLDAPSVVVRLGLGLLLLLDSSCAFIPSLHPRALSPFLSPQLSTRTGSPQPPPRTRPLAASAKTQLTDGEVLSIYRSWCNANARDICDADDKGVSVVAFVTNLRQTEASFKGETADLEPGTHADLTWQGFVSEVGRDADCFSEMTVKALKKECKAMNLLVGGTKGVLVERLQYASIFLFVDKSAVANAASQRSKSIISEPRPESRAKAKRNTKVKDRRKKACKSKTGLDKYYASPKAKPGKAKPENVDAKAKPAATARKAKTVAQAKAPKSDDVDDGFEDDLDVDEVLSQAMQAVQEADRVLSGSPQMKPAKDTSTASDIDTLSLAFDIIGGIGSIAGSVFDSFKESQRAAEEKKKVAGAKERATKPPFTVGAEQSDTETSYFAKERVNKPQKGRLAPTPPPFPPPRPETDKYVRYRENEV